MISRLFHLKFLGLLVLGTCVFAQVSNRPNDAVVREALTRTVNGQSLSSSDLNYGVTDFYSSKNNAIQHIYLKQTFNGLEVIGTESSIHLSASGEIASISNKFANSIEKRGFEVSASPQITAIQAVNSAFSHLGYSATQPFSIISQEFGTDQKTVISDGGYSMSPIPAKLSYLLTEEGTLVLVWDLSIEASGQNEWYNLRVNAQNGQIVNKISWMTSCNFDHDHADGDHDMWHFHNQPLTKDQAGNDRGSNLLLTGTYNVFPMPVESPYYGNRAILTADDAVNLNASPFGWHDTNGATGPEYTVTRGNNVNAYEDGNNAGFQPDGGSTLTFDYPFSQTYSSSNQWEPAAITNLFYWNNIIHDVFYEYGFDEAAGNFQQNNYGNGGVGSDFVRAEAQDGSGTCNANFYTPADGSLPRMQMYVCGDKDGDFDNMVIVHEYGHGISNRMTGGPANAGCLSNSEQMGEGWSDYFGLMLTMDADDQGTDGRGVGNYLFGYGPNGAGIRPYRYTTNMSVNPHTYDSIKTAAVPHGVGSVWCAMLWEMTWALIDQYGFDPDFYNGTGGNNIAIQLVVEALKIQPCSPGFVDGRDAILQADQLLYGGANQCLIWDAFAKRGLGVSANQGSSSSVTDGVQAFDTPSAEAQFTAPGDICASVPAMTGLSGGTPFGGVYSGPGVTDDGNGNTYSFDPAAAGVGVHTITYSTPATDCAEASSASDDIEVLPSLVVECPSNIEVMATGSNCSAVVTYTEPVGTTGCAFSNGSSFDDVGAPSLPSGWTTSTDVGTANNWITTTAQSSTSPNSAFAANHASASLSSLTSPQFLLNSNNAKLKFKLYYATENNYDGAVLEYSINNGGTWNDILNGGGTFVTGAYNGTLGSGWSNPLPNRQVWTGNSSGFVNVEINLNSALNGENISFRWRMGSDSLVSADGVWLDNVEVEGIYVPAPTTTQIAGLPSGSAFPVGTTTNTFQVEDADGNMASCSFDVIVTDGIGPEITCPANSTVVVPQGTTYTLPDYWADGAVTASDNCSDIFNETQTPAPGTELAMGVYTIQFTAEDSSGNEDSCSFELTVDESMAVHDADFGNSISIYPNPSANHVTISNESKQEIRKIIVTDMSGKLIQQFDINNKLAENTISVKHYASGTYLITIVGEKSTVVKKLVKK